MQVIDNIIKYWIGIRFHQLLPEHNRSYHSTFSISNEETGKGVRNLSYNFTNFSNTSIGISFSNFCFKWVTTYRNQYCTIQRHYFQMQSAIRYNTSL